MKTTPNSTYSRSGNPKGVFIATREEGGQGTNPGPKRRTRRGRMAARVELRAARGPFCSLSESGPGFVFAAPGFDEISLLGQWLS